MGLPWLSISAPLRECMLPSRALCELAGNAYNGFAVMAVLLGLFTSSPVSFSANIAGHVSIPPQPEAAEPEVVEPASASDPFPFGMLDCPFDFGDILE